MSDPNAFKPIPQIDAKSLHERIQNDDSLILLDVRNPDEWELGTIPGAIKLSLPQLQYAAQQVMLFGTPAEKTPLAELPKDKDVVVFCHHGTRSAYGIMMLRELGYSSEHLLNLEGGIDSWSVDVDPSVPRY